MVDVLEKNRGNDQIVEVASWENYLTEVNKLEIQYKGIVTPLFRGQSRGTWNLKPTLERFSKRKWTIREYCRLVLNILPQIESLGSSWISKNIQIPTIKEIENVIDTSFNSVLIRIPGTNKMAPMSRMLEFWIHLRHHGFPSPLLDWSASPYVAAYFAFCERLETKNVSIFEYIDSNTGVKSVWRGKPQITAIRYESEEERHNHQESYYTVATRLRNRDHEFASHGKVFKERDYGQDILINYKIPSSERIKVLKFLDLENINHFSLIGSEETLLKTIAFKEFELEDL